MSSKKVGRLVKCASPKSEEAEKTTLKKSVGFIIQKIMREIQKVLIIFVLYLFCGCVNDDLNSDQTSIETSDQVNLKSVSVRNGRLFFPNKATFRAYYEEMTEKEPEEIAEVLNVFYSKDFYSLVPIVNDRTEEVQIRRHVNEYSDYRNELRGSVHSASKSSGSDNSEDLLEDFDDLEDVFGEEVFNSFLNQQAELQVDDKIYKYTDAGLFIVEADKIDLLDVYLSEKNISLDLTVPTNENYRIQIIDEIHPVCEDLAQRSLNVGGESFNIEHFMSTRHCGGGGTGTGGGGGGSGGSGNGNTGTSNDELAIIAQTLDECSGHKPWLGNLFGTVKVCHDRYESKKRVKIKYYDIDVFLVYAMGIKVKHQKKGWTGLWRKQKTDEVALGVNSLTYRFNHAVPADPILNNPSARIYMKNNSVYERVGSTWNGNYQLVSTHTPIPDLPFSNTFKNQIDWLVEVTLAYHPSWDDERDVREFFYQNLFNQTKNIFKSIYNDQNMKRGVVIFQGESTTWTQIYDFTSKCTNCDKREVVLDWGIVTPQFTYTFGTGSGAGFEISSWDYDFRNPDVISLSSYGMAKRNGQWHGKRFVF